MNKMMVDNEDGNEECDRCQRMMKRVTEMDENP